MNFNRPRFGLPLRHEVGETVGVRWCSGLMGKTIGPCFTFMENTRDSLPVYPEAPHPGPVDSFAPARSALPGPWLPPHSFRRFPSGSSLVWRGDGERWRHIRGSGFRCDAAAFPNFTISD